MDNQNQKTKYNVFMLLIFIVVVLVVVVFLMQRGLLVNKSKVREEMLNDFRQTASGLFNINTDDVSYDVMSNFMNGSVQYLENLDKSYQFAKEKIDPLPSFDVVNAERYLNRDIGRPYIESLPHTLRVEKIEEVKRENYIIDFSVDMLEVNYMVIPGAIDKLEHKELLRSCINAKVYDFSIDGLKALARKDSKNVWVYTFPEETINKMGYYSPLWDFETVKPFFGERKLIRESETRVCRQGDMTNSEFFAEEAKNGQKDAWMYYGKDPLIEYKRELDSYPVLVIAEEVLGE